MTVSWRDQVAVNPDLLDIDNWPPLDISALDKEKRYGYIKNRSIVAQVLSGRSIKDVSRINNIPPGNISRLLNRAFCPNENGDPILTRALIPGERIRKSIRVTPLPSAIAPSGERCSFNYILDQNPNIRRSLDELVSDFVARKRTAQNLTPKTFHSAFLHLLREADWPSDCYPFTSSSLAYESLRKYFHEKCAECALPKLPKRTVSTLKSDLRAGEELQIDEQLTDSESTIYIDLNDDFVPLRVSRIQLILATDVATQCYLGYHLCISGNVNQFDILSLFSSLYRKWQPMDLITPGLKYSPGSCFPSHFGEPFTCLGHNIIRMDNAMSHLAHTVRHHVCHNLGSTLSLGIPAQPKTRPIIEEAFNILNKRGVHRLPSTTGSSVASPIREPKKNTKKPPVVSLRSLEECISIILTERNITPIASLGGNSPLSTFTNQVENTPVRLFHPYSYSAEDPFIHCKEVPVKFLPEEKRNPFVNFEHVRYSGNGLCEKSLIGKKVTVRYDTRDIRTLHAFSLDGDDLGTISAPRTWQRFKHGVATRRLIMKLNKNHIQNRPDPLTGYFIYLLENKNKRRPALEIARIYREFNIKNGIDLSIHENQRNAEDVSEHDIGDNAWNFRKFRRF